MRVRRVEERVSGTYRNQKGGVWCWWNRALGLRPKILPGCGGGAFLLVSRCQCVDPAWVRFDWPVTAMIRDFGRFCPVSGGTVIAWLGDIPVAVRRGPLVVLGSPLGPSLYAGDRDAVRLVKGLLGGSFLGTSAPYAWSSPGLSSGRGGSGGLGSMRLRHRLNNHFGQSKAAIIGQGLRELFVRPFPLMCPRRSHRPR